MYLRNGGVLHIYIKIIFSSSKNGVEMSNTRLKISAINNTYNTEDEYSIPLDISDLICICKEYSLLGQKMQSQIDIILELGVEQSIKNGMINQSSLPHIKNFLQQITKNAYFGDAITQAQECIFFIEDYQKTIENHTITN